jgi:hypothetical protein
MTKDLNQDWEIISNHNIDPTDILLPYSDDEIEFLVNMLSPNLCNNYNNWINIGLCLNNINKKYLYIWLSWSKKNNKNEDYEEIWKSFNETGLKIDSLLLWCKTDNPEQYNIFIKKKKLHNIITSSYPNDKLILGDTIIINKKCTYTHIQNKKCLITGCRHPDMADSMYVEILDKFMIIKCRHPECFGKTYPQEHISITL